MAGGILRKLEQTVMSLVVIQFAAGLELLASKP